MDERTLNNLVPVGQIDSQTGRILMAPQALMAMQGSGGLPMQTMGGFPGGGGGIPPYVPMPVQGGGINWQAIGGGLQVVAGVFQKMTFDVLGERAADANTDLETARAAANLAVTAVNQDPTNTEKIKDALNKLAVVDDKAQVAFNAQQRLNIEQSRQANYTALNGAAQLAGAFSRQVVPMPTQGLPYPGVPYGYPGVPGMGGSPMMPLLVGVGGGLLASHLLAPNATAK